MKQTLLRLLSRFYKYIMYKLKVDSKLNYVKDSNKPMSGAGSPSCRPWPGCSKQV